MIRGIDARPPHARCDTCPLACEPFVPSEGKKGSMIMVIGEAPGADEVVKGKPFVGRAGQLLRRAMEEAGWWKHLQPDEVYLSNSVCCRPPNNRTPTPEEIAACNERLWAEIEWVDPTLIVAMGNPATQALLGKKKSITKFRGTVLKVRDRTVVFTVHPAHVLRHHSAYSAFVDDLRLAMKILTGHVQVEVCEAPDVTPTFVQNEDDLRRVYAEAVRAGFCGIDTETYGLRDDVKDAALDPYLGTVRLIQIAVPSGVYIVDRLVVRDAYVWDLLADASVVKIGHNLKFDLKMLRGSWKGMRIPVRNMWDTMLAAQLDACGLWPEVEDPFSLKQLAYRELKIELPKEEQTSDWSGPLTDSQIRYAARDAWILLPLYEVLSKRLKEKSLERAAQLEFECIPTVADMEYAGFLMDRGGLAALRAEEEQVREEARQRFFKLIGKEININSPKQVLEALQGIGADIADTKEETLRSLVLYSRNERIKEAAQALLDYRKHNKALTSFIEPYEGFLHPITGRIHATYRQLNRNGVGRFSAADPNIQQWPREPRFRKLFRAAEGRALIIADYSAIEMRIMAWLSKDPTLMEVFQKGIDPHRRTASLVLRKPEDQVTKEDRQLAKAVNFGFIYGMSPEKFQSYARFSYGVDLTLQEAEEFRKRYFEAYSGVAKWHEYQNKVAREACEVRTASGRARRWIVPNMPPTELYNTPDQGTGADILKRAMALLRPHLIRHNAELVASVHDELVVECPESELHTMLECVKLTMEQAGAEFISPVPVEVEATAGKTWADKA